MTDFDSRPYRETFGSSEMAKNRLIEEVDAIIMANKAPHGGYVCPGCGNGSGSSGTGITKNKQSGRWGCMKPGCPLGTSFDGLNVVAYFRCGDSTRVNGRNFFETLDYWGFRVGTSTLSTARPAPQPSPSAPKVATTPLQGDSAPNSRPAPPKKGTAHTVASPEFFAKCQELLWSDQGKPALDYLHSRGLRDNFVKQAKFGYCPDWISPTVKITKSMQTNYSTYFHPYIIIPRSDDAYLARLIPQTFLAGTGLKAALPDYKKMNGGGWRLFTPFFKPDSELQFIVEGEIDAVCLAQALGGQHSVVAIPSAKATSLIPDFIRGSAIKNSVVYTVVSIMDKDPSGIDAKNSLCELLAPLSDDSKSMHLINHIAIDPEELFEGFPHHTDINDLYLKNEGVLQERIQNIVNRELQAFDKTKVQSLALFKILQGDVDPDLSELENANRLEAHQSAEREMLARFKEVESTCQQCEVIAKFCNGVLTEPECISLCGKCNRVKKFYLAIGYHDRTLQYANLAAKKDPTALAREMTADGNLTIDSLASEPEPPSHLARGMGKSAVVGPRYGEVIKQMTRDGHTPQEIAEKIGYGKSIVYKYLKEQGIRPARRAKGW